MWPRSRRPAPVHPPAPAPERLERIEPTLRTPTTISPALLAAASQPRAPQESCWTIPAPPPGVVPANSPLVAQDSDVVGLYNWADPNAGLPMAGMGGMGGLPGMGAFSEGLRFLGYAYLSELQQRSEYRRPVEQLAKEMTRRWLRITATGDDDKTETIAAIEAEFKRLRVKQAFHRAAELDGFFGKGLIYIDTGSTDDPAELQTPLFVDKAKIGIGGLKGLVVVEPIWTYPANYNTSDPLRQDFYKPTGWYVMGKQLHESRMLWFVGREVPDMLKPAYLFGGLSLSQMGKAYVDNWLRTRQSVSDLIASFSVSVLKTNMAAELMGAGAGGLSGNSGLLARVALFNALRDNSGAMAIDKDTEEWENVSTPLGSLDALQAQSQEHMSACYGIPLVVLFGITPSGLNATSEGEIAVWQSWVEAQQVHLFDQPITKLLKLVQLSLFGVIDPAIGHTWNPLGQIDETAAAAIRKSDAETAGQYIDRGVITPAEDRARLAADEKSLYPGLDPDDLPEVPDAESMTEGLGEPSALAA